MNCKKLAGNLMERGQEAITCSHMVTAAIMQIVEQTNGKMKFLQELNAQNVIIRDMVKNINEIAIQTNLLALNAGVYGSSFNVVAYEVRNIANKVKVVTVDFNVENITEQVQKNRKGTQLSEKRVTENYPCIEEAVHEFIGIGDAAQRLNIQANTLVEQLQGKNNYKFVKEQHKSILVDIILEISTFFSFGIGGIEGYRKFFCELSLFDRNTFF